MLLSVVASTGEVFTVGVVAPADARRFTYTLIGSRSGRMGEPSIMPTICPAAIRSVHELGSAAPWRTQAEGWIERVATGPGGGPKTGVAPVWSAVSTVVHVAASEPPLTGSTMSHPAAARLSSMRHALV